MPSADKEASKKSRLRVEKMRTKANKTYNQRARIVIISPNPLEAKELLKDPFWSRHRTKKGRRERKKLNQMARAEAKDYLRSGKTPDPDNDLGPGAKGLSKSKSPTKPKVPVKGGRTRIGGLSGMSGRGGAGAGGLLGSKIR